MGLTFNYVWVVTDQDGKVVSVYADLKRVEASIPEKIRNSKTQKFIGTWTYGKVPEQYTATRFKVADTGGL